MSIADNIQQIRAHLPEGVKLVCVSKYHTEAEILEAYAAGERDFGESRAQELSLKAEHLPADIRWHFIGHLQRNKARIVCRYASVIQSVDSLRLMETIDKELTDRIVDILLEVHVAKESTKTGFAVDELHDMFQTGLYKQLHNIRIRGLMGMASLTDDTAQIQQEFRSLRTLFDNIRQQYFTDEDAFDTLSMGMSDDYITAITEGSTMVRIGSLIFGNRN